MTERYHKPEPRIRGCLSHPTWEERTGSTRGLCIRRPKRPLAVSQSLLPAGDSRRESWGLRSSLPIRLIPGVCPGIQNTAKEPPRKDGIFATYFIGSTVVVRNWPFALPPYFANDMQQRSRNSFGRALGGDSSRLAGCHFVGGAAHDHPLPPGPHHKACHHQEGDHRDGHHQQA